MRLLVLSHVSDFVGGAEKSLIDVIDAWRKLDSNLTLHFIVRKPLAGIELELEKRGISYDSIDYTYWSDSNLPTTPDRIYGNALRNMRAVKHIEAIINEWKPDVVLTNSLIAPWAALAAHFVGIPHAWMVREYGEKDHGRKFEIGEAATFEDIGNLSELVYANSVTLKDYLSQFIDSKKMTSVYTPFNINELQKKSQEEAQTKIPFKTSSLKVLLTGNIAPGKGHQLLIEAMGVLKNHGINTEACFIGREASKEYMEHLYKIANELGVKEQLHFVGFQKNPLAYAKYVDIAVMPSRMEAFGRVTFEYAAVGLPVIGSNSGATPEIVIDGKTGFLYKAGDAEDLAAKIEMYVNNKTLKKQHSKEAVKHANEMMMSKYSATQAYKRLQGLIKKPKTQFTKLNYSYRWMQYPQDAQEYIHYIKGASLSQVIMFKAKTVLRPHYTNLKDIVAKLRSK